MGTFRAILFDLDGTLLPHDIDQFLPRYLALVARRCAERLPGVDVAGRILASTEVMLRNDGTRTNAEVFWDDFAPRFEQSREELEAIFADFYRRDFPSLGAGIVPEPQAAEVVRACRAEGLRTVLATNPVFPHEAIEERMRWAGLDATLFDRVTSYEWMRFCKPHPGYCRQIAAELALAPADCLMVGNDIGQDLRPAAAAGMRTWLAANAFQVGTAGDFQPEYAGPLRDVLDLVRARPS